MINIFIDTTIINPHNGPLMCSLEDLFFREEEIGSLQFSDKGMSVIAGLPGSR